MLGTTQAASLLKRWISDNTFIWLISEEILDEYKEVLARQNVRRELIGRLAVRYCGVRVAIE